MTNQSKTRIVATLSLVALTVLTNQAAAAPTFAMLEPASVPEPGATAGLLGLAILGIAALRRKLK